MDESTYTPSLKDLKTETLKLDLLRLEQQKVSSQIQEARLELGSLKRECDMLSANILRMREEQEDYCSRQGHHSEDPDVCGVLVCASCGGHVTERRIGKDDIRGFSRSGENLFLDPPSPDENKSEGHEELTPAQGIREDQELVIREATRIISYHQRQHESRHLGARRRLIQPDMSPESTGFPSPNSVSAREYVKAQSKCGDVSAIALSESMEDGEAVSQEAVYTSRDTYTVCSAVKASTEIRHRAIQALKEAAKNSVYAYRAALECSHQHLRTSVSSKTDFVPQNETELELEPEPDCTDPDPDPEIGTEPDCTDPTDPDPEIGTETALRRVNPWS